MNVRSIILLVVALVVAGFTAFFARSWISAERAAILASVPEPTKELPATQVLVAKEQLHPGAFVRPENLKWQAWPEDGITEEYVVKGRRTITDFEGAVVRRAVAAGQPITDSLVVHPGDRGFLAAVLTPGMRAVSVPVNATSGISGFVFPGDWVDVVLTMRVNVEDGEKGKASTKARHFSETLLTNVRVLAIDQKTENQEGQATVAKTATLEVSPKQAEKIALGLELGNLSLSLLSLAREENDFALLARNIKPDDKKDTNSVEEAKANHSYTMDREITYPRVLLGTRKKEINVLRGGKDAEVATF